MEGPLLPCDLVWLGHTLCVRRQEEFPLDDNPQLWKRCCFPMTSVIQATDKTNYGGLCCAAFFGCFYAVPCIGPGSIAASAYNPMTGNPLGYKQVRIQRGDFSEPPAIEIDRC